MFADWTPALLLGAAGGCGVLTAYLGGPLRMVFIARWAARRSVAEFNVLVPLVARALPLLLLFMTFLFINTEVWQVSAALSWSRLLLVIALFSLVGVAFLLYRLPEEVRAVQARVNDDGLVEACRGTPLESQARAVAAAGAPRGELSRTQRANLLLVLLVMQVIQVFLLGVAVFGFFVLFGSLAIHPSVVDSWIGHPPTALTVPLTGGGWRLGVGTEATRVALFLAAFASLYFTVYAVTDTTYRTQFLGELSRGLTQAIGVRSVYRALLRQPDQR